jgi:HlyD family secretion protein
MRKIFRLFFTTISHLCDKILTINDSFKRHACVAGYGVYKLEKMLTNDNQDAQEQAVAKSPSAGKRRRAGKRKRNIVIAAICLALAAAVYFAVRTLSAPKAESLKYMEYEVVNGDITVLLSGSGAVQPNAQYEVVSLTGGDVIGDTFSESDHVEKGALLYKMDSSSVQDSLERADLSLEKSKRSYERTADSYAGLTVTSPIDGRISELYVQEGDNVSSGGKIAKVVDDFYLTVRVPFNTNDAASLYEGQQADVTVENTFEVLDGKITKIYDTNRVLDGFVSVTDVDVVVENPGALSSGIYVTVGAGGISSYGGGALKGGSEETITAQSSGLIDELLVVTGESISSGAKVAVLSNDSLDDSVRDSQISLREAELSYENAAKQLDDYNITSPISGSIISKTIKAGDSLEAGKRTVMAVIADMSVISFTLNVDELDIAKIKKGQKASITVDALPAQIFQGTVQSVGVIGTSSNGVATFPVKIVFDQTEGLWPGMNATADILVDSVKDVLVMPVSAVNRGNTVLIKDASAAAGPENSETKGGLEQTSLPPGSRYVQVELGLNDNSLIEVKTGLKNGDIVFVPVAADAELPQNNTMVIGAPGGGARRNGAGASQSAGGPGG